ncbi:MAG: cytochrome c3 family protein [Blastocatellia bacterium]
MPKRSVSLIAFSVWLSFIGGVMFGINTPAAPASEDNCITCHSRQKEKLGQVVTIYQTSTHGRVNIGCAGCHGGDASQSEKLKAHSGHFIARPDTSATLEMCGSCHRQPLEFFKNSRHLAARPNVARLDCVECHGVHAIGAASESFRWPQFCAACHGLEYLPQLPRTFQEMLALADELREGLHRLETKGRAPGEEMIRQRKEIRHMISELVHKTDAKGAVERIPGILDLGATLKRQIASQDRK